jgi:hypothetical protein
VAFERVDRHPERTSRLGSRDGKTRCRRPARRTFGSARTAWCGSTSLDRQAYLSGNGDDWSHIRNLPCVWPIVHVAPRLRQCARGVGPASDTSWRWGGGGVTGGCMASTCEDGRGGVLAPRVCSAPGPRRVCRWRVGCGRDGGGACDRGTPKEWSAARQSRSWGTVEIMDSYKRGRKRKNGPPDGATSRPSQPNPGYITAIRLTRQLTIPGPPTETHTTPQLLTHTSPNSATSPPHSLACRRPGYPTHRLHVWSRSLLTYISMYVEEGGPQRSGGPPSSVRPDVNPTQHARPGRRPVALRRETWSATHERNTLDTVELCISTSPPRANEE